ncbi:NUDIX hydrolase [Frigidibacter oleivorans]|uniref:NUDIX hydrolase n=1 Tax=Frigidibacter oleivorans TaxID=2487129 RepID=UPI001F3F5C51|nr:NUDIX hydrolase [Frigidibacter oleivorans]
MNDPVPIRDAATIILVRRGPAGPAILMGQRGAAAVFMPSKFVFPGGALDPGDAAVPLAAPPDARSTARLAQGGGDPRALAAAAIRELWEETGLRLAAPGDWDDPPPDWTEFAAGGFLPDAAGLTYVFRAITPQARTRRFDARFFLADAARLTGNPDDFGRATDELSFLHWVPVAEARQLDLPFITEVVLAEVAALLAEAGEGPLRLPESVPFFDSSGAQPVFRRIA